MKQKWFIFSPAFPGSLAWLDGSDISYSNWVDMPDTHAACGLIQQHSGFQWESTENCSRELNFICQFGMHIWINQRKHCLLPRDHVSLCLTESGRSIACDSQNATLECGSGQVLEIDDSFYGRKTVHYCRSKHTASPSSSQEECSWVDVTDSVSGIMIFITLDIGRGKGKNYTLQIPFGFAVNICCISIHTVLVIMKGGCTNKTAIATLHLFC